MAPSTNQAGKRSGHGLHLMGTTVASCRGHSVALLLIRYPLPYRTGWLVTTRRLPGGPSARQRGQHDDFGLQWVRCTWQEALPATTCGQQWVCSAPGPETDGFDGRGIDPFRGQNIKICNQQAATTIVSNLASMARRIRYHFSFLHKSKACNSSPTIHNHAYVVKDLTVHGSELSDLCP